MGRVNETVVVCATISETLPLLLMPLMACDVVLFVAVMFTLSASCTVPLTAALTVPVRLAVTAAVIVPPEAIAAVRTPDDEHVGGVTPAALAVQVMAPPPTAAAGHVGCAVAAYVAPVGRLMVITTTPFVFTPVVTIPSVLVRGDGGLRGARAVTDSPSVRVVVGIAAWDLLHCEPMVAKTAKAARIATRAAIFLLRTV
jgi:hypothetical protein